MGIMKNGPHGSVYGKVGNLVTYRLLGEEVVRLVGENNKPPSLKQLACRLEMAIVIEFLKPMIGFINVGFLRKGQEANKYPHNLAVAYNKRYALTGVYPSITMDYSRVLLAQGSLAAPLNAAVELVPEGIKFSWDAGPWMDFPERRQMAMMLAYFPVSGTAVYCLAGAKRIMGFDLLSLGPNLLDSYMETYLSFMALPDNEVADSVYTGALNK